MQVAPSATVAINTRALQKKAAGVRVYNLSAGEPMVPTHAAVVLAAQAAMDAQKTHYPPVAGIPELRAAAANWMNTTYNTQFQMENCLVTCGGKFGLFAFFQAFINPGDEVIIVAPHWVSYPSMVKLFGGIPQIVTTKPEADWKVLVADLEKAYTKKTKILSINNAANPTGVLYSRSELEAILAWAKAKNIMVVSDEVYSGLVYDGGEFISCASFPAYRENVVIVQSCSKHFAMTGWRVGFVFGPRKIIEVLTMLQSQSTTGTSSISQWAALAAIEQAGVIVLGVREAMQKRRDVFIQTCNRLFGASLVAPASALYVFAPLSALGVQGTDSTAFAEAALERGSVALVPGVAFGQEGYVRFSFGDEEEELVAGLEALHNFIN